MSGNTMIKAMCTAVFSLGLFASAVCSAHGGGGHGGGGGVHGHGGGGYHGGGGWPGGGGYYHGHGGGYYGGGWGWSRPSVIIGAPFVDDDYYAPACQTVRVCNNYGHCWLQESCY